MRELSCEASNFPWYFGLDYEDAIEIPHPWQNLSPAMMRVPHLAQKFEARRGAAPCASGPSCAF
jgi:hypothetical protein